MTRISRTILHCLLLLSTLLVMLPARADLVIGDGYTSGKLAPHTDRLCDPSGRLTLDAVRRLAFQPDRQPEISLGFRQPACWFHTRLSNRRADGADLILSSDFNIIDRLEMYVVGPDGRLLDRQLSGDAVAYDVRSLKTRTLAFPLTLPAGESRDIYLRAETTSTLYLPLRLSDSRVFLETAMFTDAVIGLFYGIALGLLFYHLVLWLMNRDRMQAWYLSYVFFTFCFFSMEQGSLFRFWPHAPAWNNAFLYTASFLMLATALMFSRRYLGTAEYPRLHRGLAAIAAIFTLLAVIHPWLAGGWIAPFNSVCALATISGVMLLGVLRWQQGRAEARLFLIAWGLLLLTGSIFIVMLNLGIPGISSLILCAQAAFAAQQILLSIGLAQQVRLLEARNAAQEQENRSAKAESAAKSEFLARMSHEIRTPLNAMLGVSQLMIGREHDPARQEQLDILRSSGEQLLNIVNDILDYSKITAGKLELERLPFHLPSLLKETADLFAMQARQKELAFHTRYDPALPEWVLGDPTRFRQILFNLLGNAVKFTESGQVSLTVEWFQDQEPRQALCRFLIEDTGIGMSPEEISRLFTSFRQADASITRRYGGAGLGLAISKQLADLMQAQLEVKSTPGKGSVFVLNLTLPVVPEPAPSSRSGLAAGLPEDLCVLVCEDNTVNRTIISAMLTRLGVRRFELCTNGSDALTLMTERHNEWDLVLMDCEMPVMDGLSAVRALRKWERELDRPHLPVVALTAHVMPEYRQRCRDAGMDSYLAKPVVLMELERHLRHPVDS
ncbi:hypothetical protein EV700_1462 [Fluviicoccus keumensis]|uniref:histidine kinase n=1 Tax=Fluviicoccus keumensis TaxID=1435465 RepID=A0A4Q7ZAG0_9GAMM|nr:hybrid sensor histidine kinase/response regulator [Fluviicoccus keumensis]RZU47071.1 hypothetical protein EV700_1462 [Fluviicoccus keumensis]